MTKLFLCLSLLTLGTGCTNTYYSLSSPDGQHCLVFEEVASILPKEEPIVNLYINNPVASDKTPHIKLRWSGICGVTINWKSKPIKIRSFLIRTNSLDTLLYDVKVEMNKEEEKEFDIPGFGWKRYDFVEVRDGNYKRCANYAY